MNLNKVLIVGRVTADPQLRSTAGGQSVTTFSVATNRVWTDKANARQEETEFHTVVAWGRQAEIASQFLVKGALVLIEGRLRTRGWQDKQGQSHKTTEIICERLQLGPRSTGQGGAQTANKPAGVKTSVAPKDAPAEEIPVINLEDENSEEIKPEDIPF